MSVIYLKVTKDKYELPIAIADSVTELARICNVSPGAISSGICHDRAGRQKHSAYKKVEIEDD